MCNIESFVFFDIETTGLPWQEKNRTKITELSFVAVLRKDLMRTEHGDSPPVSKLTFVLNPTRPIHPKVVAMTGLSNDLLQHAPVFVEKLSTVLSFLQDLPKPVCLVAHNGSKFDFKILKTEFEDVNCNLPSDLLCVDSLIGFRKVLGTKDVPLVEKSLEQEKVLSIKKENVDDLITDDEDDWPNLNVSTEEWDDIDRICDSLSDISCEDIADRDISIKKSSKKTVDRGKVIRDVFKKDGRKSSQSYTLLDLYKRLMNREPINHHRAEDDCLMLLQCVVATKEDFVPWADNACMKLNEVKPLIRY